MGLIHHHNSSNNGSSYGKDKLQCDSLKCTQSGRELYTLQWPAGSSKKEPAIQKAFLCHDIIMINNNPHCPNVHLLTMPIFVSGSSFIFVSPVSIQLGLIAAAYITQKRDMGCPMDTTSLQIKCHTTSPFLYKMCCQISNIRCAKSQNSNVVRLILLLSLHNLLKPWSREWRWNWSSADRRWSNYIWVINNFTAR